MTKAKEYRWVVCQLGARMHYAVPRIIHRLGRLETFYTDIHAGVAWPRIAGWIPERWRPSAASRLAGRVASHIPASRIHSFPAFGMQYYLRRNMAPDLETLGAVHLWAGSKFGRKVLRSGFGGANAVYAFNTAALEIIQEARELGLFSVLEQTIAPRLIEEQLLAQEQARFPDWEPPRQRGISAAQTAKREAQEWSVADLIVCGSSYVKEGIARAGGPVDRCVVVPYGVDSFFSPVTRADRKGPLRVLIVGDVSLRKGAPYAMEAAKALQEVVSMRWVGLVNVSASIRTRLSQFIEITDAVPRSMIRAHYDWADVFFLPSVCEGSATVTYEALSCGLPVITTPNSGSPVIDGQSGFIVPESNAAAMTACLRQLNDDRDQLARMSAAAIAQAPELSLDAYETRLSKLLSEPKVAAFDKRIQPARTPA